MLMSCSFQPLFLLPGQHGVSQPQWGDRMEGAKQPYPTPPPHTGSHHPVPLGLAGTGRAGGLVRQWERRAGSERGSTRKDEGKS